MEEGKLEKLDNDPGKADSYSQGNTVFLMIVQSRLLTKCMVNTLIPQTQTRLGKIKAQTAK